jgi:hypothetical protein
VLGGKTNVVAVISEAGPEVRKAEGMQQDSARCWGQRLRACCAAQVATTVPTDIDTENYQQRTGPPSTSRLLEVVIVG